MRAFEPQPFETRCHDAQNRAWPPSGLLHSKLARLDYNYHCTLFEPHDCRGLLAVASDSPHEYSVRITIQMATLATGSLESEPASGTQQATNQARKHTGGLRQRRPGSVMVAALVIDCRPCAAIGSTRHVLPPHGMKALHDRRGRWACFESSTDKVGCLVHDQGSRSQTPDIPCLSCQLATA